MSFQDIRRTRGRLSAKEARLLLLAFLLLAVLLALNISLARVLPGGEQFFLRWSGARAYLIEGIEPYSTTVAQRVQIVAYGRHAFSGEYPFVLNDPFPIVLLYIPLVALREWLVFLLPVLDRTLDFPFFRGLWMTLSEIALVGTVHIFIRSLEWEPPRGLYLALMGTSLFGYYSLAALGSGTPAVVMVFLFFAALSALRVFSDELAGALLFLVAYQWEVSALFFLFMAVFIVANRRWRALNGFLMSLVVLLAASFLAYPGWTLPYARGVLADGYRSGSLTFGHLVSAWFPEAGFPIGTWAAWLMGIALVFEWFGAVNAPYRRIAWTACLSLAVTPLMGFAIFPSNHVVLVPPAILITMLVWERWTRRRAWLIPLFLSCVFLVPFWLYYRVITGAPLIYSQLLAVLPSFTAILGLYWMRWWAFRSPRTWLDQIEDRK
ncbi:MAG: hypothetical protein HXY42_02310 [Chloroflexi bacterium]|nr:hypothetical protein [Chloroflexota bacterium]